MRLSHRSQELAVVAREILGSLAELDSRINAEQFGKAEGQRHAAAALQQCVNLVLQIRIARRALSCRPPSRVPEKINDDVESVGNEINKKREK